MIGKELILLSESENSSISKIEFPIHTVEQAKVNFFREKEK
jgi:hypothetical protein